MASMTESISIPLTGFEKQLLLDAAAKRHLDLGDFARESLLDTAQSDLVGDSSIRMTQKDYDWFIARLDEPPRELPQLREQMAKVKPFHELLRDE